MPRIKEVTIDGLTLRIAPLTFKQHRDYVEGRKANADAQAQAEKAENAAIEPAAKAEQLAKINKCREQAEELLRGFVCTSLNNAAKDGEPRWTLERLDNEMDLVLWM